MTDKNNQQLTIAVDMKRYGLRIHKPCYRMLGEPKYIQLLVNPDEMVVAIRGVERALTRDSIHKINEKRMYSDHSYEIYSRSFVKKLCEVVDGLDEGYSYRLIGEGVPSQKTVVFSLKTLQKIER